MSSFDKVMAAHVEARQYGETFVDFTNDLVSGVITTLVKSGMDQMTSYAELINAISVGQSTFQQNVTGLTGSDPTTPENIVILDDYIDDVFAGVAFATTLDQLEADGLIDHFNGTTIGPVNSTQSMTEVLGVNLQITEAQLREFVFNKLMAGAAKNYDTLVTLVREGWIKILPTDWKVATDLEFHITSEDTSAIYSSYYNQKSRNWAASHSGTVGFNLGKILSLSSTNTASISGSKLRVRTGNTTRNSSLTSDVMLKGHVSISGTAVQHPSVTIEPTA